LVLVDLVLQSKPGKHCQSQCSTSTVDVTKSHQQFHNSSYRLGPGAFEVVIVGPIFDMALAFTRVAGVASQGSRPSPPPPRDGGGGPPHEPALGLDSAQGAILSLGEGPRALGLGPMSSKSDR